MASLLTYHKFHIILVTMFRRIYWKTCESLVEFKFTFRTRYLHRNSLKTPITNANLHLNERYKTQFTLNPSPLASAQTCVPPLLQREQMSTCVTSDVNTELLITVSAVVIYNTLPCLRVPYPLFLSLSVFLSMSECVCVCLCARVHARVFFIKFSVVVWNVCVVFLTHSTVFFLASQYSYFTVSILQCKYCCKSYSARGYEWFYLKH